MAIQENFSLSDSEILVWVLDEIIDLINEDENLPLVTAVILQKIVEQAREMEGFSDES